MLSRPDLSHELAAGRDRGRIVVGMDEVGRGPLAGPVVVCALLLPDDLALIPDGVTDSKKLTPRKRESLAERLRDVCPHSFGRASVAEIDEINILQATFLAMRRAIAALPFTPHMALIDGNQIPKDLTCRARCIVQGDSKSLSIAAASILAKVERDTHMISLSERYPGYGWHTNAGYGSAEHLEALARLGATEHHRRSFSPVAQTLDVLTIA